MAWSNGKITLFNPKERSSKFCSELKTKTHQHGKKKGQPLTDTEAAYRSGYLDARKESGKIFRKKNPDYKKKSGHHNLKKYSKSYNPNKFTPKKTKVKKGGTTSALPSGQVQSVEPKIGKELADFMYEVWSDPYETKFMAEYNRKKNMSVE